MHQALSEVINKADKGSTIVVEDRYEYIKNAMLHLNDPNENKPLCEDISLILKEQIIDTLSALKRNGFLKQTWFDFSKHTCTHIKTIISFF